MKQPKFPKVREYADSLFVDGKEIPYILLDKMVIQQLRQPAMVSMLKYPSLSWLKVTILIRISEFTLGITNLRRNRSTNIYFPS